MTGFEVWSAVKKSVAENTVVQALAIAFDREESERQRRSRRTGGVRLTMSGALFLASVLVLIVVFAALFVVSRRQEDEWAERDASYAEMRDRARGDGTHKSEED